MEREQGLPELGRLGKLRLKLGLWALAQAEKHYGQAELGIIDEDGE